MKTWNVRYCRIPTNYHDNQAALVEAETAEDAHELVRRMLGEDRTWMSNYVIAKAEEYQRGRTADAGSGWRLRVRKYENEKLVRNL